MEGSEKRLSFVRMITRAALSSLRMMGRWNSPATYVAIAAWMLQSKG